MKHVKSEKPQQTVHLMIRFSDRIVKIDDTISEHLAVLERYQAVWFGKLGKPVGRPHQAAINRQLDVGIPTYIYLVQNVSGRYKFYRGTIAMIALEFPEDEMELVPEYYSEAFDLENVRFWAKLVKLTSVGKDEIVGLSSISSIAPIISTLQSSMAGFFVVRERRVPAPLRI